jgi:UDP-N-acetylmuramoyl-tripeptide--D-alanyl-D-alanine ligase
VIALSLAEIAQVTGGSVVVPPGLDAAAVVVDGPVVTDSREAGPGGLFVARSGEHADGHDFVAGAVGRGAVAALVTRPVEGVPCVVVADTQDAFAALAREVVRRLPAMAVVGITGSSGKTSTKDLLGTVLATAGPTVAPVGSYNSEVGVPLTVCRVTPETRFLVVEMGARGIGHIAALTKVAPPTISVVLNVGSAHLGEYGGVDAIAAAKGELVEALPAEGVAVLNSDDPRVEAMSSRTTARVVRFGRGRDAVVRAEDVRLAAGARAAFTLVTPEGSAPVELGYVGEHQVGNALAAAAVSRELGLEVGYIAEALSTSRPQSRWRMEVVERDDEVTVINDAYNASPESMRAALDALVGLAAGRRTWAVLGEMRELGDASVEEHRRIGRRAAELAIDRVVVIGDGARPIAQTVEAVVVPDVASAVELLEHEVRSGDVVLVKASRSIGLERVAAALLSTQGVAS